MCESHVPRDPVQRDPVQRDRLRTPLADPSALGTYLEDVVQLSKMGARPRDRVLLALTALWAPRGGRPTVLPRALRQSMSRWLEEAREPALDKLWGMSGGER